jgi:predicted acetyltransferase
VNTIKRIPTEDDDLFLRIAADAYPVFKVVSDDDRKKFKERFLLRHRDPRINVWGLYRDEQLLGGLRLFDYAMNVHGASVQAGGGGMLAVDIQHKREHVARDLMTFFLRHYREKKTPLAILWPFRPDFYKKMGFGYGSKIYQYRVRPQDFPDSQLRQNTRLLTPDDHAAALACYNSYVSKTTGMIEETEIGWKLIVEMNPQTKYLGYEADDKVTGFMAFSFEPGQPANMLNNDIRVSRMIYTSRDALSGLLGWLHSQHDEINYVHFTTYDEHFEYLLNDVRDHSGELLGPIYHRSHLAGIGMMYRVIDVPTFFAATLEHSYGNQSCRVRFTVRDSFLPENDGSTLVKFADGRPEVLAKGKADFEVSLDVAEFSSMVLGAIPFRTLYEYGLAEITDSARVVTVDELFKTERGPICTTMF